MRTFGPIVLLVVILATVTGAAAALEVDGGTLQTFVFPVSIEPPCLDATVDIKPDALQTKSQGQPVMAYIELPEGHDVADVDVTTVRLCCGIALCGDESVAPDGPPGAKPQLGDYDGDGIPDLKLSFDRSEVIALVTDVSPPANVTFTVSGVVKSLTFAGSDTVKLLGPKASSAPG